MTYGHFLTDQSLRTIVHRLSPNDFSALVPFIGISHESYQTQKRNNPHDIGEANFQTFIIWRRSASKSHRSPRKVEQQLVEQLLEALGHICRNDIRRVILDLLDKGPRSLTGTDFIH